MFALRRIANHTSMARSSFRALSETKRLIDLAIDQEGIATVTLQRPPVNGLNLELLQNLSETIDEVDKSKCKGMILTSSSPTVFSAGLDLKELYKPDKNRITTFYLTLQEVLSKLFGSGFVTAAAINGHAPAGACILTMCCEYRAMVKGDYTIGLNEVVLGLAIDNWLVDLASHILPMKQVELMITTGTLFNADGALKVGLIDETATNKEDSINKCKQFIRKFDTVHPIARAVSKRKIRKNVLANMQNNAAQNSQALVEYVLSPSVQEALEKYNNDMKQRKAAKQKTK